MSHTSTRGRWERVNDRNKISMDADTDLSPVRQLMRDAEAWPVLSVADERQLARDLRDGAPRALVVTSGASDPTWHYASGPWTAEALAARERLTCCNIRLVISIAKRYHGESMELSDFIQAGTLGLMRAVESYDLNRGHRLTTHATQWIRQAMSRALDDEDAHIRLPVHLANRLRRAAKIGDTVDAPGEPLRFGYSLNPGDRYSDELTIGDQAETMAATETQPVEDEVVQRDLLARLMPLFARVLTPRERMVMRLRYGLGTDADGEPMPPRTLTEVGAQFGYTRQWAQQIEARALRELRRAMRDDGEGGFRVRPHAVASTAETEQTALFDGGCDADVVA